MSWWRLISVVRPAQYKSSKSVGSSGAIAAQYVSTSPVPTVSPAARSSREKPTSSPANGARPPGCGTPGPPASGTGGDLGQIAPYQVEVVAVLDDRAQRV